MYVHKYLQMHHVEAKEKAVVKLGAHEPHNRHDNQENAKNYWNPHIWRHVGVACGLRCGVARWLMKFLKS